jgi:hypothetical protein
MTRIQISLAGTRRTASLHFQLAKISPAFCSACLPIMTAKNQQKLFFIRHDYPQSSNCSEKATQDGIVTIPSLGVA